MPRNSLSNLNAKIAIITSGSRGIGRHSVLNLAKRGVDSIFTYHSNEPEAEKVVSLAGECISSQRDSMIVARHEVPGKRPPKEPSRRVRYDRAPLIFSSKAFRTDVRAAVRCDGPFPEHIDFFCFHVRNFVIPILHSPNRSAHTCRVNKRTDRLKRRDRIVIEQEMRCRGNFDHVNVAIAKPGQVGKRLIPLAIQKELWHP
jgi:hypothetical protein